MAPRARFSTQVDAELQRQLRTTVVELQKRFPGMTLAACTEQALRLWLTVLAQDESRALPRIEPDRLVPGQRVKPGYSARNNPSETDIKSL